MTETKRVPEIRFGGFKGKWIEKTLEQETLITMGQSPEGSSYTQDPTDHILVQGNADLKDGFVCPRVWTTQVTKTAKKGDLIISVRAPVGDMGKTGYNIVIGRGVAAIRGNEFIFQLLTKMNAFGYWSGLSSGSTFDSINSYVLKNAILSVPTEKTEQEKIGQLLQALDDLIALRKKKYERTLNLKKAMLEKLFPKPGETVPQIRFKGFTGEWKRQKLEEYLMTSIEKNEKGIFTKQDVLSVSGDFGIVNQIEFQGRSFAGASILNYGVVKTGDVVYTKSPLSANPFGIIKTNKGRDGIVSTLYAVYKPQKYTCSNFVQVYFELNYRVNKYLNPLVNKGAKNDMKITAGNALKGVVIFPSYDEQVCIAEYFEQFDNLINFYHQELEKLQNIKKALLAKMFV